MKKLTLLLCACTTFLFLSAQNAYETYLAQNRNNIDLKSTDPFDFLPSSFYENQLFLFGENHGASQPHEVDFSLFKNLYYKANVRHYIAEVDVIKAWMLNQYLKDGNEDWLNKVFQSWRAEGAQWANKSNWKKYQQLHSFYKALPKKEKFSIVGIDVTQDYSLVKNYFSYFFPKASSTIASVNHFITVSDTIQYKNRRIVGELARNMITEMQTNPAFKKELKKKYAEFELLMKTSGYVGNKMHRDSIMYRTFQDMSSYHQLNNKKLYGFLGFYHTLQVSYDERNPFAACLKNNQQEFAIASIQMFAIQSKVLLPYNDDVKKMMPIAYVEKLRSEHPDFLNSKKYVPYELSNDQPMMKVDGIEDVKKITTDSSVTFFSLNNANTPFTTGKKLAEVTGFQTVKMTNKNDYTTKAFQYIILFRKSPAGIPFE
jgi:hypothetical protein